LERTERFGFQQLHTQPSGRMIGQGALSNLPLVSVERSSVFLGKDA
jgi:hypothetical protein